MSDRFFLDTNIFVYSTTDDDPAKSLAATELIARALSSHKGVVSYQVVQEFFNLATKKFELKMALEDREDYLEQVFRPMLRVHSSTGLMFNALRLQSSRKLQWYDSLVICAAQQAGCGVLYTEDLQHGQRFGDLRVVNPFLD